MWVPPVKETTAETPIITKTTDPVEAAIALQAAAESVEPAAQVALDICQTYLDLLPGMEAAAGAEQEILPQPRAPAAKAVEVVEVQPPAVMVLQTPEVVVAVAGMITAPLHHMAAAMAGRVWSYFVGIPFLFRL
jgi:hypothetical protein